MVSCTISPPTRKYVTDKEAIQKVVEENMKELRVCYERLAQRDPNVSGRVDFKWIIQTNGLVEDIKIVKSQIKDEDTLECMIASLATWKFPESSKKVALDISYPFIFVISDKKSSPNVE